MSMFYRIWWGVAIAVFIGLLIYYIIIHGVATALAMAVFVILFTIFLGSILKRFIR